ncbi:hypothetical protein BJ742DRAFT_224414 [Cladochytrium replicatum]|nr:hypothetical protein BJ742DRAFT_224414 [Cladochytrium replicatum]
MPVPTASRRTDPIDGDPLEISGGFIIGVSVCLTAAAHSSLGVNMQAAALKAQHEHDLLRAQELANWEREQQEIEEAEEIAAEAARIRALRGSQRLESEGSEGGDRANGGDPSDGRGLIYVSHESIHIHKTTTNVYLGTSSADEQERATTPSLREEREARWKQREAEHGWKKFSFQWQWYLGLGLYISTQMFGSIVALIFISPIVLAPLGSSGLIFNVLFSKIFLGTTITRADWWGTLLIVFGCSLISLYGNADDGGRQTIEDVIRLYGRATFIIYFAIQNAFALSLFALVKYMERSALSSDKPSETPASPSQAPTESTPLLNHRSTVNAHGHQSGTDSKRPSQIATSIPNQSARSRGGSLTSGTQSAALLTPLSATFSISGALPPIQSLRGVLARLRLGRHFIVALILSNLGTLLAVAGGIMASETLLLSKTGVELLIVSIIGGENQFQGLFAFLVLIILVLTIVVQLYCLNRALYHATPVLVIPLFFTLFTCLSLVGSMIYFDSLANFAVRDLVAMCAGLAFIVGGVWMLRESQAKNHEMQQELERGLGSASPPS